MIMIMTRNCKFHDLHPKEGGNFGVKSVKLLFNFLSTQGHGADKLKCIVMMTKEGSTKIVNFMTLGQGFLC